jgi:hypothetical protein
MRKALVSHVGGTISWSSGLQPNAAQSCTEAEYMGEAALREVPQLRKLHQDLLLAEWPVQV